MLVVGTGKVALQSEGLLEAGASVTVVAPDWDWDREFDGIGPDDLKVTELLARVTTEAMEVILAMNPNVEGEATTLYLTKLLRPFGMKLTRIARGIPVGTELEFADDATLSRALASRTEL